MFLILYFSAILIFISTIVLWRRRLQLAYETGDKCTSQIKNLKLLKDQHEIASRLWELVEKDGAGTWPPRARHDSWPMALRPYKDIYLEIIPLLSTDPPSLDDDINTERRSKYRLRMRKLFSERVNIAQVEEIMKAVEEGNWDVLPRDAYNGFYCCVAVCRHAYR
jgi:hypothetical protein